MFLGYLPVLCNLLLVVLSNLLFVVCCLWLAWSWIFDLWGLGELPRRAVLEFAVGVLIVLIGNIFTRL